VKRTFLEMLVAMLMAGHALALACMVGNHRASHADHPVRQG
jgi:hypothetical protein